MRLVRTGLWAALVLLHGELSAQPASRGASTVDSSLATSLQQILDTQRQAHSFFGLSAAVMTAEDELWTGVSGTSDSLQVLDPQRIFGIGSITKTFTAAAILQLVDGGTLALDDSLGIHLTLQPNVSGSITLRQLLSHTSGIYNYTEAPHLFPSLFAEPARHWTPGEILESFVLDPVFDSGSRWRYSNTNYILLGMIVESVTGSALGDQLRARFHQTLGLDRTFLVSAEASPGEWATGWSDLDGDGTPENIDSVDKTSLYSVAWAAGGLASTAADTVFWIHELFSGAVLPAMLRVQMMTPEQHSLSAGFGYGLGAARYIIDAEELWGHSGGIPGFASVAFFSPEHELGVVVLLNQDADPLPVAVALFQAARGHVPTSRSTSTWSTFKSKYR